MDKSEERTLLNLPSHVHVGPEPDSQAVTVPLICKTVDSTTNAEFNLNLFPSDLDLIRVCLNGDDDQLTGEKSCN